MLQAFASCPYIYHNRGHRTILLSHRFQRQINLSPFPSAAGHRMGFHTGFRAVFKTQLTPTPQSLYSLPTPV